MSLGAHQSARYKSADWLTPPDIIKALGPFDLDPCCPASMPWRTARRMVHVPRNGLAVEWRGRVWLNPPFGNHAVTWLRKMAEHGDGIALLAARTETQWFFECVWGAADSILFLKSRPHFHYPDGKRAPFNSGAPITLVAYGHDNGVRLRESNLGHWAPILRAAA